MEGEYHMNKQMKGLLSLVCIAVIVLVMNNIFGFNEEPIVGTWKPASSTDTDIMFSFDSNGSGYCRLSANSKESFKWKLVNKTLQSYEIRFTDGSNSYVRIIGDNSMACQGVKFIKD